MPESLTQQFTFSTKACSNCQSNSYPNSEFNSQLNSKSNSEFNSSSNKYFNSYDCELLLNVFQTIIEIQQCICLVANSCYQQYFNSSRQ